MGRHFFLSFLLIDVEEKGGAADPSSKEKAYNGLYCSKNIFNEKGSLSYKNMKKSTRKTIKKEVVEHEQRRRSANYRERQRTQELNAAFNELREKIPSMPADKLSKVHSLRIATAYITYLVEMLNNQCQSEFIDCNFKSSFHVWRSQRVQEQLSSTASNYKSQTSNFLNFCESNYFIPNEQFYKQEESKQEDGLNEYSSSKLLYNNASAFMDQKSCRKPKSNGRQ